MTSFRGLTWDHPRGFAALERAAAEANGIVTWDRQPLEGFESAPIEDVCAGYDLVVLDHPHLGDALAAQCLQPLDAVLPAGTLAGIRRRTLGPCFESYEMAEHVWALPLDAAAQVSAGRPDLMVGDWPVTFAEVERASREEPGFVMSLAGPHAFLSLLSLSASLDAGFGPVGEEFFQPCHDPAIALFQALASRSDPQGLVLNPIGILDRMAKGELAYCPLIFGYAPYAHRNAPTPLAFGNSPRAREDAVPRAVLGGTGIALTARCKPDGDLAAHLAALLSPTMQEGLIPATSGQPSAEAAWLSPAINAEVNGFYRETVETLRHAFLRPRHAGFVPDQTRASAWLRENSTTCTPAEIRQQMNRLCGAST
ncbi:carbohydrate ABC transporter substrate-binding protein [Sinorhizobium meliloti]|uniref:carbohydrate ABC transporter substrate-binding protein n=1 Tax=Rhizobium meliloti TaxID=382 RepID=UPI000FDBBA82|nr:carbohydrate ABC transporter substrate-binding protein [Sinorhizobium meliloti]RVG72691.1 carbohydrate ABC transporter substrate-binding protein [Sinorhizobium meliloti]RVH47620.1 carbohydrate ABC transporter substrate-binding protein [Sinorhizobium meliloti]RVO70175.1 carbohydrate ABC transporter substrate-binding protein [Sinorhizobium meliloti]